MSNSALILAYIEEELAPDITGIRGYPVAPAPAPIPGQVFAAPDYDRRAHDEVTMKIHGHALTTRQRLRLWLGL